jgi:hypothetical protein
VSAPLGLASLSASERAGLAAWLREALALVCLVGIAVALYLVGDLP